MPPSCTRPHLRRDQAPVPGQLVHLSRDMRQQPITERSTSSPVRSSRPTSRTRSPRSPASSCARRIVSSTAATSSRQCRRISTGRTTTSISSRVTSCRRSSGSSTTPRRWRLRGRDLGNRMPQARIPPRRRSRRRLPLPDASLRRRRSTSTSVPESICPMAELAGIVRDVVYPEARDRVRLRRSPTARRESCSTCRTIHALGWRHKIGLRDGVTSTYNWY